MGRRIDLYIVNPLALVLDLYIVLPIYSAAGGIGCIPICLDYIYYVV